MAYIPHFRRSEAGWSLIELLMVMVIIGVLAAVAIPNMVKAREAAQKTAAVALLRNVHKVQTKHHALRGRYGTVAELSQMEGASLGALSGSTLTRDSYLVYSLPVTPTTASLARNYTMVAVHQGPGIPYVFLIDQDGLVEQFFPEYNVE